jgi:Pyridoxamine 5'-phosphate oxidase
MSDLMTAIEAYRSALIRGDAAAVAGYLAGDVLVETNFGRAEGAEAALALLREPRTAGLLAGGARWLEPAANGDEITVVAELPATAPFGGLELVFTFAGDKIARVEQQTLPAAPLKPMPLLLTEEIKGAVDGALDNATPMLIAYSDESGEIHLSFRGTVQSYSADQLALWARDPDGGLPRHIAARPKVTLFYHDPATRTSYTFYGRARVEEEPAARATIFENSHPRERQMDFRRRGVAIVVDLDRIEGRGLIGRILMTRSLA